VPGAALTKADDLRSLVAVFRAHRSTPA